MNKRNLVASIQQRLRNKAKQTGEVLDYILVRFAIERLLYRLANSTARDEFILKGAMLFHIWSLESHRPTRDLDLLGFGTNDAIILEGTFKGIIDTPVVEDGLVFDRDSVSVEPIREEALYGGLRIKLLGKLGNIRIPVQVDVGFGDAVIPGPKSSVFPTLLPDLPSPTIQTYPTYTVIAEKLEAMVSLGEQNSRMKDFYDLRAILRSEELDAGILIQAIESTFRRRETQIPFELPVCLTETFAKAKATTWSAFLRRNGLGQGEDSFTDVVSEISYRLPVNWYSHGESGSR